MSGGPEIAAAGGASQQRHGELEPGPSGSGEASQLRNGEAVVL